MKTIANEFFCRMHYGTMISGTPETMHAWGLVVRKIASADGMSESERAAWAEIGRHLGAPEAAVEQVMGADLDKVDLSSLLQTVKANASEALGISAAAATRAMLYDAIVVAHTDGYSAKERALAAKCADILGVDQGVLRTIEALVEADLALRAARGALLSGR